MDNRGIAMEDYQIMNEILNRIKQSLCEAFKEDIWGILLFGSAARGEKYNDIDIFIVVNNLPDRFVERIKFIRRIIPSDLEGLVSVIARTKKEFEGSFPSYYLDIGLDGKVLYEKDRYLTERLERIREIIRSAGLVRRRIGDSFIWEWKRWPESNWKIDWNGVNIDGIQKGCTI